MGSAGRLAALLARLLGISWPPEVVKDGVSEPFFQEVKSTVSVVQGQTSKGQQLRTWGSDSGALLQKRGLFLAPKSFKNIE